MAAPLLQAEIDINAPVEKVWALIADLNRMPQCSPQCRLMKTFGPLRPHQDRSGTLILAAVER
jgi:uncharacterized membrane protein